MLKSTHFQWMVRQQSRTITVYAVRVPICRYRLFWNNSGDKREITSLVAEVTGIDIEAGTIAYQPNGVLELLNNFFTVLNLTKGHCLRLHTMSAKQFNRYYPHVL